jgi:methylmalonyl-CoA mutase N-terminal domain/subunit
VTRANEPVPLQHIDPALEAEQVARLQAFRAARDGAKADAAIAAVERAARDGANVMPPIVSAVDAHATVGEISDALRRVFGEHDETLVL